MFKNNSINILLVQSVHFPDSFEINLNEQLSELSPPKTVDQAIELINSTKKRDLTDWNLAEHYDPKVLVQVTYFKTSFIFCFKSNLSKFNKGFATSKLYSPICRLIL